MIYRRKYEEKRVLSEKEGGYLLTQPIRPPE